MHGISYRGNIPSLFYLHPFHLHQKLNIRLHWQIHQFLNLSLMKHNFKDGGKLQAKCKRTKITRGENNPVYSNCQKAEERENRSIMFYDFETREAIILLTIIDNLIYMCSLLISIQISNLACLSHAFPIWKVSSSSLYQYIYCCSQSTDKLVVLSLLY